MGRSGEGVSFELLRVSPERGTWANLIRVSAGGKVERHRHRGAVQGWVMKGRWRYLEHEWVATPGSYIFEPENGVHTLVVEAEEMVTLFMIDGPIEILGRVRQRCARGNGRKATCPLPRILRHVWNRADGLPCHRDGKRLRRAWPRAAVLRNLRSSWPTKPFRDTRLETPRRVTIWPYSTRSTFFIRMRSSAIQNVRLSSPAERGPALWDSAGRQYIDGTCGLWQCVVGHRPCGARRGGRAADGTLEFYASFWKLCETNLPFAWRHGFCRVAPANIERVFFTSGGSEGVETAIKLARLAWRSRFPDKTFILSRENAFHGVTSASLAATGMPLLKTGFRTVISRLHSLDGA